MAKKIVNFECDNGEALEADVADFESTVHCGHGNENIQLPDLNKYPIQLSQALIWNLVERIVFKESAKEISVNYVACNRDGETETVNQTPSENVMTI